MLYILFRIFPLCFYNFYILTITLGPPFQSLSLVTTAHAFILVLYCFVSVSLLVMFILLGFFPKFSQITFQLSLFFHHLLELLCFCFMVFPEVRGGFLSLFKFLFMGAKSHGNISSGSVSG